MDPIILNYDLERSVITTFYEDLYLNQRTEYVRKKSGNLFTKILLLLIVIVISLFMLGQANLFVVLIPGVLLAAWAIVGFSNQFPKVVWWWAKKSLGRLLYWDIENNGDGQDVIHYEVSFVLDAIDIVKKTTQTHYQWSQVQQVIFLESCVVIYLSETNCLCVPKSLTEGYEQLVKLIKVKQISYDIKVIDTSSNI